METKITVKLVGPIYDSGSLIWAANSDQKKVGSILYSSGMTGVKKGYYVYLNHPDYEEVAGLEIKSLEEAISLLGRALGDSFKVETEVQKS